MQTIAVTGGSGKAGRATIAELLSAGYTVRNIDITAPAVRTCDFYKTDLNQLGETIEAMHGCDAVVHLAANPDPTGTIPARPTTSFGLPRSSACPGWYGPRAKPCSACRLNAASRPNSP